MYRVLLVDDREIFRLELKRMPVWGGVCGFCVAAEASDGLQAVTLLRERPFDLVLTDIRMPKADGIELLKMVKQKQLCPCVVLMSEYTEFSYARSGLVLGAFDYLVKPVEQKQLSALLDRAAAYLENRAGHAQGEQAISADAYASASIGRISAEAVAGRQEAVVLAKEMLAGIYDFCHGDLEKTIEAGNRNMFAVLGGIWKQCPWLRHYYRAGIFSGLVHSPFMVFTDYQARWGRVVARITEAVHDLMPLKADTTIGHICLYMLEHPEEDISLQRLSSLFYINRSYLSGAFHKKAGISFNTYMQKIRMLHARLLMETEQLHPDQISARLGYRDVDYFTRLFKKAVGEAPSSFLDNSAGHMTE